MVELLRSPEASTADQTSTGRATTAGRILQLSWAALVLYGMWAAAAAPEHPPRAPVIEVALGIVGIAVLLTAAGLAMRKRWALRLSAVLALPVAAAAVLCALADSGSHWVAEAVLAATIVGATLHPGSWRMHRR